MIALFLAIALSAQAASSASDWQQRVHYEMDIRVDVETHRYSGTQRLTYTNNSPDTLHRAFYHLYFNAFQPGSMMDVRSRTIADPDGRVRDRIFYLDESDIGYLRVRSLLQDGEPTRFEEEGTILAVDLARPVPPGATTVLEMEMDAQVPEQIRRSGKQNAEGIEFSMAQWYPKISAYDEDGWHPNPYIGREFYAPFGTFDVTLHIDRDYVVAASAVLQNPQQVGHGYEDPAQPLERPARGDLTWKFRAENVHDFMWAADPDYTHTTYQMEDGPLLRFFYQTDPVAVNAPDERQADLLTNWQALPEYTARGFRYAIDHYGKYPYPEYVVIQGGDGGMEYIMGTLITGNRSLQSLVGVTVHEFMHSWYQGALAVNESYFHWMDEGFTSFATNKITSELFGGESLAGYSGYYALTRSGLEEPLATHADQFITNGAYRLAAYSKGAVFLGQMEYIIGKPAFDRAMLRMFDEWKFRHPDGKDILRVFERESGMVLDWYYDQFVYSTRTVDYAVESVGQGDGGSATTRVSLVNQGTMPMPLDIDVTYEDGTKERFNIPLRIMRGEKPAEDGEFAHTLLQDWPWVEPGYSFDIPVSPDRIRSIEIDASGRLADVDRSDNRWESP